MVSMETKHDVAKNSDLYAPVVIFQNSEGRQYRIVGTVASSPPEFTVGDKVPVTYQKERPSAGQIASFRQKWFLPMIIGCIGAAMSGMGLLLSLGERWLKGNSSASRSIPVR